MLFIPALFPYFLLVLISPILQIFLPLVSFIFCVLQAQNFATYMYMKIGNTANSPNKVTRHAVLAYAFN